MTSTLYIKIDNKQHRVFIDSNESLIDACNRNNIDLPQSCLSGYCSTCKCKLVSGLVSMDNNLCLTDGEVNDNFILSCQSKPISDKIVIDFD